MCYYDEDFYNEPSEFEQQIYEFKEALSKQVRDEFIEKMDKLEKENAELQTVKKDFDKIKQDYEDKKRKLDYLKIMILK